MRFSLVTLFVEDPAAARDWYARNLGLTVAEETPRFVRLADASGQPCLALHAGGPVGKPGQVQLHFEVDDVDAEYERLRGEGLTFDQEPADMPWGWRVVSLEDPAGHTVEFVQPL